MANRLLKQPTLLHNIDKLQYFTRHLNSSPATAAATTSLHSPIFRHFNFPATNPQTTTPILDLNDHQKIFSSVSTPALLRAAGNLHVSSIGPVVDFGIWFMNSKLMENEITKNVVTKVIRHTFFEHFCAGENAEEAVECVSRLNKKGLRGMLAFAVEHTSDDKTCEENFNGFLKAIKATHSLQKPLSASCVIVKITAICPINLLKRVSDLLRWQQKDPSFHLPWKQDTLPIFAESSPLYHTLEKPEPLSPEEENILHSGYQRLSTICENCIKFNTPLTIDAEDTYVQPAIDYFTYSSAIKYSNNKEGKKPLVYGTIQTYLKDAKDRLCLAINAADKMGVSIGFKLVRGAYMSSEKELANSLGFESPIHNTIEDTHACFNGSAAFMLDNIANGGSHGVILATHNVDSGKMAAKRAREIGIKDGDERVEFAQLYGMSDGLSYSLKNAGFYVSKYMPFGPLDKVMSYLLRRAEENRGMLSTSSVDKQLMRKELGRRLKATIV